LSRVDTDWPVCAEDNIVESKRPTPTALRNLDIMDLLMGPAGAALYAEG